MPVYAQCHCLSFVCLFYKIYKKLNLRKEVGITIKSKETSSQLKPVKNSYVAIMNQPVTVSSAM